MSEAPANILAERPLPTIEVSGTAVRQQPPKCGVVDVLISEKGASQESALTKFQDAISRLNEAIGSAGTVSNVMPHETSEEVSRGLRSGVEHTVTADIEVEFTPANYGHILEALVKCGLPISTPRFTYDDLPKATPELLAEAAATAKENAAGIAVGVGGKIGRLVSINVGPPRLKPVFRQSTEIDWALTSSLSFASPVVWAHRGLNEEKLETYDTEVQVTVEYEIIEDSAIGEVA